jgi:hypothetical protein
MPCVRPKRMRRPAVHHCETRFTVMEVRMLRHTCADRVYLTGTHMPNTVCSLQPYTCNLCCLLLPCYNDAT